MAKAKDDSAKVEKVNTKAPESPAPAQQMDSASGAVIEPEIKDGVDMSHPAIDSNPRKGTTARQNARDMNDPSRRTPNDEDYVGQGLDPAPYGKSANKGK